MTSLEDSSFQARSAGYLANHMARLFSQALAEAIAPLGLAPAQFMVLLELWKADEVTQRDLARRLDVEQATMANTLGRMARDGLVRREPHPRDSRAQLVLLTDRARELRKPAKAAARTINTLALAGLSRKEQDRLVEMVHKVIAALKAARDREEAPT